MKKTFLKRGACAVAAAALVGCMVPAAALADDDTQTSSGTGTTEVTSESTEVLFTEDCSWTATYPTSVTVPTGGDGDTLSAAIEFNVKGKVDVDHVVTITPTSSTITLVGENRGGKIEGVSITGCSAAAASVNTEAGADVKGSVSLTVPTKPAVDKYAASTTFRIKCAKDGYNGPDLSDSTKAVKLTIAQLKAAKADSSQADNLKAYAESGLLQITGVLKSDATATATLVNYNADGSLTFMTDKSVGTSSIMDSSVSIETGNFSNTVLYTKLQSGGDIYKLYSSDVLENAVAQDKLVSANYNDAAGAALATLSAQKLWLPSYSEVFGTSYNASYNAGSTAEGTQMSAFKSGSSYTAWKSGYWWLRSARYFSPSYWLSVSGGSRSYDGVSYILGVRPCFTL